MSKLVFAVPNFPGKEKLVRATSMAMLKVSKHSPEICVGVGIAAGIGATVLACRATLRVDEVLEYHNQKMSDINKACELVKEGRDLKGYTLEEGQKEKWTLMVQTIAKIGKLYAPSIIMGSVSIGLILGGHHILAKRNMALSVAYAGLQKAYDEYRERVRNVVGEEKENDIYKGVKEVVVEETNSKGKVVQKKVNELEHPASLYTRIFDESSDWWSPNPEQNKFFLMRMQAHCNDRLRMKGFLFLNEVLEMLDIPRCPMGQDVGWIYGEGDSFVSFGIWDPTNEAKRAFINGAEKSIWLDFNVDGFIKDRI